MSCVCSSGYTLVDGICVIDTPALSGSSGVTIYTIGYPTDPSNTTNTRFAERGVFFYEDITNKVKPLTFFNNSSFTPPSTVSVAPGQPSILVDGTNFTPSSASSYYGYDDVNISGVPISVLATASTTNTLWCSNGSSTNGRMNLAGVRAYYSGFSGNSLNQWIGIPFCIDVPSTQQYHILFGADDVGSIRLDNEWLVKRINNNLTVINDGVQDRRGVNAGISLDFNHVIPITLDAGSHVFEFYWSDVFNTPTNGIFEIYSGVTTAQLTGFTTNTQLNPYIVASTSAYSNNVLSTLIYPPISGTTPNGGLYCTGDSVLFSACTSPFCRSQEFLTSYCIYGTNTIYDDNYNSSGEWNGRAYWLGENNGYVIYYSSADTQWCLSTVLDGSCFLFGKSPCVSECPDICENYLSEAPCPSPTPSPTSNPCLTFDFAAVLDCEFIPTSTPTPTPSVTPTMTPTPSTSPLCSVIGVNSSITGITPTATATPTPTPSSSPSVTRPCNFSGDVTFNVIDTVIGCPVSKVFMNCLNGDLYYTMDNIETPSGDTLTLNMVFNGSANGGQICMRYMGIDETKSGVDVINLISGPLGTDCSSCESTTTTTSTIPPITTTTTTVESCNCYQIATKKSLTISYIDCSGNTQTKSLSVSAEGFALICARQTPTVVSGGNSPYIIELFDNCINGFCASRPNCGCYSITNNSSTYTLTYWYYDCSYEYKTSSIGPNTTSSFFCSIMVPFIIDNVGFTINSFGNCSGNECSGSIECNILDSLSLTPNNIDTSSILTWNATYSGPNAGLLYMDVFASWFCTGETPLNCTRTVYFNGGGVITSILQPSCTWSTGNDVMEITGNSSSGTILFGRAPNGTPCSLTDVDYMLITLYYECPDGSVFSTTTYYGLPNNSF